LPFTVVRKVETLVPPSQPRTAAACAGVRSGPQGSALRPAQCPSQLQLFVRSETLCVGVFRTTNAWQEYEALGCSAMAKVERTFAAFPLAVPPQTVEPP